MRKIFGTFGNLQKATVSGRLSHIRHFAAILMLAILHSRVYNRKQSSKRHCSNIQHFECCR